MIKSTHSLISSHLHIGNAPILLVSCWDVLGLDSVELCSELNVHGVELPHEAAYDLARAEVTRGDNGRAIIYAARGAAIEGILQHNGFTFLRRDAEPFAADIKEAEDILSRPLEVDMMIWLATWRETWNEIIAVSLGQNLVYQTQYIVSALDRRGVPWVVGADYWLYKDAVSQEVVVRDEEGREIVRWVPPTCPRKDEDFNGVPTIPYNRCAK